MKDVVVHPQGVWRARANYLIHVDLAAFGMPGRREQLWARSTGPGRAEICCIPFFSYGIALGDIASTWNVEGTELFLDILEKRGYRNVRVALVRRDGAAELHGEIHSKIASQFPHEWHGIGYLALAARDTSQVDTIMHLLSEFVSREDAAMELD